MELERDLPYALQTSLDRAIGAYKDRLAKDNKLKEDPVKWKKFIQFERGKLGVAASIQAGLEKYRSDTRKKEVDELEDEKHSSQRLGDHMRAEGFSRPSPYWHAHAIVAGGDTRAWQLRAILAECSIELTMLTTGVGFPLERNIRGNNPIQKQCRIAVFTDTIILHG